MNRQPGLTLIEVMIAMLLMLLVAAGAIALTGRARAAYRGAESLARLNETADAALDLVASELRMAGYLGLAAPGSVVAGSSASGSPELLALAVTGGCGTSLAHDLGHPFEAADGAYRSGPLLALGCRPGPAGRAVAGADTLTVRYALAARAPPAAGRLQLETLPGAARLAADGQRRLGPAARWHDLEASVFYVSADSVTGNGRPSLRRKRLVGGTRPAFQDEELVEGIEDLQVEIGFDDPGDADSAVDYWAAPGEFSAAWPRAARLWIRVRSDMPEGTELVLPALQYANRSIPEERSRYRRAVYSAVVELRNATGR